MICKHCGSMKTQSRGYHKKKDKTYQQYLCTECKKYTFASPVKRIGARILLLDIETSLMEFYGFSPKTEYLPSKNVIKDWSILCWSAKWIFDTESVGMKVTPQEAEERQDKRILRKLWDLLDEADIVIHQNGKKFDIPKINSRLIMAGFPPPSYYQQVDTKESMKRTFGFSYNSQEWIAKVAGLKPKTEMIFEDWINCLQGREKDRRIALKKMLDYNLDDVHTLEEMYLWLRPWISSHANLGLYEDTDKDCCPNCSSTELKWIGNYATQLGLYESFRCLNCGAIGRSTKKKYKIKSVDVRN